MENWTRTLTGMQHVQTWRSNARVIHVSCSYEIRDRSELPYHLSTSDTNDCMCIHYLSVCTRMQIPRVLSSCVVSDRAELPYHLSTSDTNDCMYRHFFSVCTRMHIPHVLSSCVVSDRAELPCHIT